jgi:hypothetical protein
MPLVYEYQRRQWMRRQELAHPGCGQRIKHLYDLFPRQVEPSSGKTG